MRRCSSSQVIIAGERVESSEAVSSPLPFSGPFNDMVAELGLDGRGDLVDPKGERGLLELLDHLPTAEEA